MSEERFFIDHGVIHDRVTGKHVRSYDVPIENSGEDGIVECCALMNKLSGAEDANVQDLVSEVRRLRVALKASDQRHADFVHGDYNKLQDARHAANREMVAAVAQAKTLLIDVDDMMGALREVASEEYTWQEKRDIARRSLDRLKVRGV